MGITGRIVATAGILLIFIGLFLPVMCDSDEGCDESINLLNDPTFILDNEDTETRLTFNEYLISNAYGLMILFLLGCTVIATIIGDRAGMLVAALSICVGLIASYGLIDRLVKVFDDEAYAGYGWIVFLIGGLFLLISPFIPRYYTRQPPPSFTVPAYGGYPPPPGQQPYSSPPPPYPPQQPSASQTPPAGTGTPPWEQSDPNQNNTPSG